MTPEETEALMADIEKVRKTRPEIAIVIIEHDMTVIKGVAGRVSVFNYGSKITEGTYAQISSNEEVLEAYLGKEEGHA
jgi:branched-chain amino acid transport system ATP-binding protein/sulfate-transporting ATPase